jgi:hypothetical protein
MVRATPKSDVPRNSQVVRSQTRLAWRVAILCGLLSGVLSFAAINNWVNLSLGTAWRLPFAVIVPGWLTYLLYRAFHTGRIVTDYGVYERATRPRSFYLHIALVIIVSCAMVVAGIGMVYVDPRR